jgi:hypothetical protein
MAGTVSSGWERGQPLKVNSRASSCGGSSAVDAQPSGGFRQLHNHTLCVCENDIKLEKGCSGMERAVIVAVIGRRANLVSCCPNLVSSCRDLMIPENRRGFSAEKGRKSVSGGLG